MFSDVQAALFDDTDNILSRRRMTNSEHQENIASLNEIQRVAFDSVMQYTRARHHYFMEERDTLPEPLHLFVTSGAGIIPLV